jgi:hypothetical protein
MFAPFRSSRFPTMSFANELLAAGASVPAVLHEFLLQHDPKEERIHAFCEGYEDPSFYRPKLEESAGNRRTFFYRCHGKWKLFAVFDQVTARVGTYRHTLYFVDKDLSDLIPESYPKDDRIYVTDYYSIENYLASKEVIGRVCSDFVILKGCSLPKEKVVERFVVELSRFQRLVRPMMAWTICVRRKGLEVALQNLKLSELFSFDTDLRIRRKTAVIPYLREKTGVPNTPLLWADVRAVTRSLKPLDPKRYVRGKFETWFLVEFIKAAIGQLHEAAKLAGGGMEVPVRVERSNAIALLAPYALMPSSLDAFLSAHLDPKA